jgi:glucose-1-phosphate thymidylyltransferase
VKTTDEKIDNIVFIIREDVGPEDQRATAGHVTGTRCTMSDTLSGRTTGALLMLSCARETISMTGCTIVAFADTLFKMDFKLGSEKEGVIFVQKVADPAAFGVVKLDKDGIITDFVEKPKEFVSDSAIIGIYYFRDGAKLRAEMQYLIDNKLTEKGEYQLTNAMENMKAKGARFEEGTVIDWLDCGNKNATVDTNAVYLSYLKGTKLISDTAEIINSVVIEPCFIDEGVKILNSVVGPYVSIGKNTTIEDSIIKKSIIQTNSVLKNKLIENSMVGNNTKLLGKTEDLSIGDYVATA